MFYSLHGKIKSLLQEQSEVICDNLSENTCKCICHFRLRLVFCDNFHFLDVLLECGRLHVTNEQTQFGGNSLQ